MAKYIAKYINEDSVRLFLEGEYDETDVDGFMEYLNLTADIITVKRGKWIETGDYITTAYGSVFTYRCSECKAEIIIDEYDSYCPNCGAKMGVPE